MKSIVDIMEIEYIKGKHAIRLLFERTLENKDKILRTALSDKPLVYLVGEEFSDKYMDQRRESKIFLRSLRFSSNQVDLPKHQNYDKYLKETRIAPKAVNIGDSVLIWDDFVAIINTKDISGVIIHNKNNAQIMKKWFDFLWENSS